MDVLSVQACEPPFNGEVRWGESLAFSIRNRVAELVPYVLAALRAAPEPALDVGPDLVERSKPVDGVGQE